MADSLVSLNARTAARSASGPSTAVASATRAAGFDNESSVAPTATIIGCVDAAPSSAGDERSSRTSASTSNGFPPLAVARSRARSMGHPGCRSRASSVASNRVSGFRWTTAVRGSLRRRATPSPARAVGSARDVASTRSGTCSSSSRNMRWRSRSMVATSAQSTSSTKTTVGVVRAYPSTRLVTASSVRVRSRSITSGASVVDGSSASARTRSSTSRSAGEAAASAMATNNESRSGRYGRSRWS